MFDTEQGARVRKTYTDIMHHLAAHPPSPSTETEVHVNNGGGIAMLIPTDAYALGKSVVVRYPSNPDGTQIIATYHSGKLMGKAVNLPKRKSK